MALYVASHYKNQPNDLQLMSDAPAHHLFVLLPPIKDDESHLPEPLVVLQVALEGNINKNAIMDGLSRGVRSGGDMIPWLITQQFQENKFGLLSGARVVRIATHPDYAHVSFLLGFACCCGFVLIGDFRWDMDRERYRRSTPSIAEYFSLDETSHPEPSYPHAAAVDEVNSLLPRDILDRDLIYLSI